jgi:hypothetical protein
LEIINNPETPFLDILLYGHPNTFITVLYKLNPAISLPKMGLRKFIPFLLALPAFVSAQGFGATCTIVGLYGVIMQARCEEASGEYLITALDLNQCVGNNNGALVAGNKYINLYEFPS